MKSHIKKVLRKQRTNKHGQRSILFTKTAFSGNMTHAESILLSMLRDMIATEKSPIAYADWDTWELLRCEVFGILNGKQPLDLDRKADPLLYLAVDAIAAVVKQRRKRHAKNLRESQVREATPTTTTEGGTTDAS